MPTINKKDYVTRMFDGISGKYDFLNHFLSMGIDRAWRKKAINLLKNKNPLNLLDVATGTADMAILASVILNPQKITGIDLSQKMLDIGYEKVKKKKLENKIALMIGDSLDLPFESNKFDAVTVAFGVRNFENPLKGLQEMFRVLKKEGRIVILEFSVPEKRFIKPVYLFYFKKILPFIGSIFSNNDFAYSYLPVSVSKFPQGENFLILLRKAGFEKTEYKSLSLGICSIYSGIK